MNLSMFATVQLAGARIMNLSFDPSGKTVRMKLRMVNTAEKNDYHYFNARADRDDLTSVREGYKVGDMVSITGKLYSTEVAHGEGKVMHIACILIDQLKNLSAYMPSKEKVNGDKDGEQP